MKQLTFTSLEAKSIIESEYVLALPTETVYGLGVRWDSSLAYDRLCECKHRRPDKPIAVMCSDQFDLTPYFEITLGAKNVMKAFLPGPLTCLVRAKKTAPFQSHLGTFIAGIRIPAQKELLDFLSLLPYPLQVTSANLSGQPSTASYEEVCKIFDGSNLVKGAVKGRCDSGTPTTVVDLTGEKPIIVRQGEIVLNDIMAAFLSETIKENENENCVCL